MFIFIDYSHLQIEVLITLLEKQSVKIQIVRWMEKNKQSSGFF